MLAYSWNECPVLGVESDCLPDLFCAAVVVELLWPWVWVSVELHRTEPTVSYAVQSDQSEPDQKTDSIVFLRTRVQWKFKSWTISLTMRRTVGEVSYTPVSNSSLDSSVGYVALQYVSRPLNTQSFIQHRLQAWECNPWPFNYRRGTIQLFLSLSVWLYPFSSSFLYLCVDLFL